MKKAQMLGNVRENWRNWDMYVYFWGPFHHPSLKILPNLTLSLHYWHAYPTLFCVHYEWPLEVPPFRYSLFVFSSLDCWQGNTLEPSWPWWCHRREHIQKRSARESSVCKDNLGRITSEGVQCTFHECLHDHVQTVFDTSASASEYYYH